VSAPLVSVICPTYNQERFVAESLDGILAQRYPRFEVVVCDDGSQDSTCEIVRAYASRRPDVVRLVTGDHVGITANCNRGLAECRGEFLAMTAGDDVLLPGKLVAQVAWFEADARRVLCGHDVEAFDSDTGATLFRWSERFPMREGRGAATAVVDMPFCATAIMIRRSAIPPYGFDPRIPVISDWKLVIDSLGTDGEYGFVPGIHARYRRHPNNTTSGTDPVRVERMFDEVLQLAALVESEHPVLAPACRRLRARHLTWAAARTWRAGQRAQSARRLRSALREAPRASLDVLAGVLAAQLRRAR
jgi:glycosyltransferase involved in cell wall biosynthesis